MPTTLKQMFARTKPSLPGCKELYHQSTWKKCVETDELPFHPGELEYAIRETLSMPENRSRGDKLMIQRRACCFTLYDDGAVHRPEEALERLIVSTNKIGCFNQVPVGGGKESIDLMCLAEDKSASFIELKPWMSKDTPFYALIESVKNLELYRLVEQGELADELRMGAISLTVLAPVEYYIGHGFEWSGGHFHGQAVLAVRRILESLCDLFNVQINMAALNFSHDEFKGHCKKLVGKRKREDGNKVCVEDLPPIRQLHTDNWVEVL